MKLFIGFDIGDAETIIAFAKGNGNNVTMATMPGKNAAGMAIPTLYGYTDNGEVQLADSVAANGTGLKHVAINFKRRPSDLIYAEAERIAQLIGMDDSELWEQSDLEKIRAYADKLNTFVKVILTHPDFVKILQPQLEGCDSCEVVVGHPTKWNDFDIRLYELMLRQGILGENYLCDVPLSLNLESESRAAFLYIRDAYKIKVNPHEKIGLVDVGSSTIDISVIQGSDSRNCIYNDGQNFLGARSIDYLIMEYCIEQFRNGPSAADFEDIFGFQTNGEPKNPAAWDHLLINCRFAKEKLFSAAAQDKSRVKTHIFVLDLFVVTLSYETLVNDICERPIAPVLKKYTNLRDADANWLKDMNWKQAFKQFITDQREKMAECGIELSGIFLTGSASRMFFVNDIVQEVFGAECGEQDLMNDTNTSNSIANGLSRVGVSEEMAEQFEQKINDFVYGENGLKRIVATRIPDLISDISGPILSVIVNKVIKGRFIEWQNQKIKTMAQMKDEIKADLSDKDKLNDALNQDADFSFAVEKWIVNKVGEDIAAELLKIATEFKVHEFSLKDLNAFNLDIDIPIDGDGVKTSYGNFNLVFSNALGLVVGVVSYLIIPYILSAVFALIVMITETLWISILMALLNTPEVIVTGILVILGTAAGLIAKKWVKKNQEKITQVLDKMNLPKAVRKKVKYEDVEKTFMEDKDSITKELQAAFSDPKKVDELAQKLTNSFQKQVQLKADEIKYSIISNN